LPHATGLLSEADWQPPPSGSVWPSTEELQVHGETKVYNGLEIDGVGTVSGDSVSYYFCPTCGSTIYWTFEGEAAYQLIGMAVGNFVDPAFPAPTIEVTVVMRHSWIPPIPGVPQYDTYSKS
jgi:hypothetical protein